VTNLAVSYTFSHTGRWGPSASEGPQKHGSEPQYEEVQRMRRLAQNRSCSRGTFGMIVERGIDLKGKRLFKSRWITIESLAKVKGMSVILHGLRPMPINR
jgi:hypothetical protein